MSLSITILWCLNCSYQRAGKINLIHLASKELFRPEASLMLPFPKKDGLILSNLMHKLAYLGIQTSRRFQFYSDSLKLGERVNSEIWGSPGSRQLLHLQQFPKILKKNWTLLYFELVSSFLDFSLLILAFGFLKRLLEIGLLSIDWFLLI